MSHPASFSAAVLSPPGTRSDRSGTGAEVRRCRTIGLRWISAVSGGEEPAALDGQLDLLEEWRGRPSNADAPDEQAALGFAERGRHPRGRPTEAPGERRAVELFGGGVAVTDRPQHRHKLVIGLGVEHRLVARHRDDRFLACSALFSPGFSFKVLPDFFD
jgi:hypothetical protein